MIEKPLRRKLVLSSILSIFIWIFSIITTTFLPTVTAASNNDLLLVNQNPTPTNTSNTVVIAGVIVVSFILLALAGVILSSKLNSKKIADIYYRDKKRKYDLERIRYSLSAFAKTYGRYPDANKSEYTELLEQISPLPVDPLANQDTGFNHQVYNYYYDNQSLNSQEKGRDNTAYYRLWCHLENGTDPDINQLYSRSYRNIYLKTSIDSLNPTLLEEPKKTDDIEEKKTVQQNTPTAISSEDHRRESLMRFLLMLVGIGLIVSAIVNGIFYYLISNK